MLSSYFILNNLFKIFVNRLKKSLNKIFSINHLLKPFFTLTLFLKYHNKKGFAFLPFFHNERMLKARKDEKFVTFRMSLFYFIYLLS